MIYGNVSGPFYHESDEHFRAKMRIAHLLDKDGWDVWVDDMKGFAMLALARLYGVEYVPREYRFDIYAEKLLPEYEWMDDERDWMGPAKDSFQAKRIIDQNVMSVLRKVIVEIDYKGHLTKWSKHKGDMRDEIWKNRKIATVRFPLKWIVGKKKIDDNTIIKELEHSQSTLKRKAREIVA